MKITLFGTCRLLGIENYFQCTDIHSAVSYVHSTKEIIQLIKFLKGETIPHPINRYCFRAGIIEKRDIVHSDELLDAFNNTDLFVVEISSTKTYRYKKYYVHHLAVDKRLEFYKDTPAEIEKNTIIAQQNNNEIENDLDEIRKLLKPKKILVVSHINARIPKNSFFFSIGILNKYISNILYRLANVEDNSFSFMDSLVKTKLITKRNNLIKLLEDITTQKDINFFDPSVLLQKYSQQEILIEEKYGYPPGHYTDFGQKKVGELFADKIRTIISAAPP